jgi:hypothetical protein
MATARVAQLSSETLDGGAGQQQEIKSRGMLHRVARGRLPGRSLSIVIDVIDVRPCLTALASARVDRGVC